MKKSVLLVALFAFLFAVPLAHAAKGEFTFGLDGGVAIPTGDFGNTAKQGFLGGVFGDYQVHNMLAVGIDGAYSQNKGKDLPAEVTDAKLTIIQYGVHVKVMPEMKEMKVLPYVQVGAGLYNAKSEFTDIEGTSSDTQNKFGFNIGVGADYKVTPMVGVGVFGTYHNVTDALEEVNPDLTVTKKAANYVAVGLKITFMTTPAMGGAK